MNLKQIVSTKDATHYSPTHTTMYQPYADVLSAREAKRSGNIALMKNDFYSQLVLKRRTLIRRSGSTDWNLCLGVSNAMVGFMWPVRTIKYKPNMWQLVVNKVVKPETFTILDLDAWVVQSIQPVSPMFLKTSAARSTTVAFACPPHDLT